MSTHASELRRYKRTTKPEFLAENPWCCICGRPYPQVHHVRGRLGSLLNDWSNLRALCLEHHARAHSERAWGEANGLMESRLMNREQSA